MGRAGRPRKSSGGIAIAVARHPNGSTVRNDRPGPHPRHVEIRNHYGYDAKDQVDINHIINRLTFLTEEQRKAGLKYDQQWQGWKRIMDAPRQKNPSFDRTDGKPGLEDQTEEDQFRKNAYEAADKELRNAGMQVHGEIEMLICFEAEPFTRTQRERIILGLDALSRHYGLT